jgi:DNA-binding protein HU-beta
LAFFLIKCLYIISKRLYLQSQKPNCLSFSNKKINFMNKAELINAIAEEAGLSKVDAKKALEAVVKSVSDALVSGDKVSLIGFGTFSVTERAARPGINPATKQAITIEAKKVAKFKAGAELTASIN